MGGKTGTTTQNVQIPPEVMARYNAVNARAEKVANRPFKKYSDDPSAFVAQLNQQQQAGINNINQYANAAQPAYQAAMQGTAGAYQGFSPEGYQQGVQGYMNPFLSNAMGATAAQMQNINQQQQQQMKGSSIGQGAFGGDRANIGLSNLINQQNLATGQTLGQMASQGYQSAAQNYLAGLGQQGQLAAQMGALGAGAQAAGLQGAQAQLGAGTLGQQTEQAGKTALYNQFLQQQAYPFQVAQFLANIAMGTGALSGSQTTTTQPMSFFSDRRLKHDIKRIGESDKGLPIYAFKYKHDPDQNTHIGFMADEVEHVRPEAVGLAGGYKTVNYDKIANDNRAEGGAVGPQHAGLGFMAGGREHHAAGMAVGSDYNPYNPYDPTSLQNILAVQKAMFASPEQHYVPMARQLAGGIGKGSRVPETMVPVGQLMKAGALPDQQPSTFSQGMQAAETGEKIARMFDRDKSGQATGIIARASDWLSGKSSGPTDAEKAALAKKAAEEEALAKKKALEEKAAVGKQGFNESGQTTQMASNDLDFGSGNHETEDLEDLDFAKGLAARGGRMGYSTFGEVGEKEKESDKDETPQGLYSSAQTGKLDIPDESKTNKLMSQPTLPGDMQDPTAKDAMKAVQLASTLASLAALSDRRLKHDIKRIGEADDGLPIYAFKYKNDPEQATRVGFMADEVEKVHPDAVGLAGKYKTVNYDKIANKADGGRAGYATEGEVKDELDPYLTALRKIESSHNYGALGPVTKKGDRAYGAYQVMGANIPQWTQKALGQTMTPDEFLADKAAQDKVARYYFGQAMKKYGTPQDAASVWFTGRPLAKTSGQTADITGTTVPKYIQRFNKAAGIDQMAGLEMIGGGEGGLAGDQPPSWYNPTRTAEYRGLAGTKYAENEPTTKSDATKEVVEETAAPPTEPSETKGGVSPLDPKYMAWTAQAPGAMEKLATGLGIPKDMQDSSLWVPALAGIGSMLSSRSPFLLPAIGEGLVGAAAAYPKARQAQADLEATRTGTMAANMAALRGAAEEVGGRMIVHVINADGTPGIVNYGDYLDNPEKYNLDFNWKDRSGGLAGGAPAGGATPKTEKKVEPGLAGTTTTTPAAGATTTPPAAGATTTPDTTAATTEPAPAKTEEPAVSAVRYNTGIYTNNKLDPETQALAERTREAMKGQSTTQLSGYSPDVYRNAETAATGANTMKSAITELTGLLTSLPRERSIATSGALQPIASPILKRINNLLAGAGANTIAEKEIGMQEAISKAIANLKAQAASANNMEAVSALGELGEQFPTFATSPQGTIRGMARVVLANQRAIDQDNYFKNFRAAATNPNDITGAMNTGAFANIAQVFQNKMAPQYENELKGIEALENQITEEMVEGQKVKVSMFDWLARNGGRLTKEQVLGLAKTFEEKGYGADLLRYFPSIRQDYYLSAQ